MLSVGIIVRDHRGRFSSSNSDMSLPRGGAAGTTTIGVVQHRSPNLSANSGASSCSSAGILSDIAVV
jgi:hypothetical protein